MFISAIIAFIAVVVGLALFNVSFTAGLIGFIIAGGAIGAFVKTFFDNKNDK